MLSLKVIVRKYWVGQEVCLGFRTILWKNMNELFDQPNRFLFWVRGKAI